MMRAGLKKSLADVGRRKGRTLLVVLGIFVGVIGLTGINFIQDTVINAAAFSFGNNATQPDIVLDVNTLDPTLLPQLSAVANVQTVQYESTFATDWLVSVAPGSVPMTIRSYPDLQHVPLTPFELTSGRYPGVGEIVMEYGDVGIQAFKIGDTVSFATAQGSVKLKIVGIARTPGNNPAASGDGYGYMSDAGLNQAFGTTGASAGTGGKGPSLSRQISVKVANTGQASTTATALKTLLQAHQVTVYGVHTNAAHAVPIAQINGVFTLLRMLAILAVVMSGLLILNTVTTLIAEQSAIIGTMKAIGGTRGAIMRGYLTSVVLYSALGTLPALTLGIALGYPIASALASTIPLDVGPFALSWWIVLVSLAVGFGVPLLAALLPLWNGTRISVRDALAAYGVSAGQGNGVLTRAGQWLPWVAETTWLGLRGTFRKRWRAVLTLMTITLAGTTFLVVQTANASVNSMVASVDGNIAADVQVFYFGQQTDSQLSAQLQALPNVQRVEHYDQAYSVSTPYGSVIVKAFDPNTQIYHYHLLSGRWLTSTDTNAVLLSDAALAKTGLHLGDSLTLTDNGHQATWTIIGTLKQPINSLGEIGAAVTSIDTFTTFANNSSAQTTGGQPGSKSPHGLLVQAHSHTQNSVDQLANTINVALNTLSDSGASSSGPKPLNGANADVRTFRSITVRDQSSWFILYALLYSVALIVGIVGILGLANALTASVLERRREIGMLRAMGANGWQVARVFWTEGLTLGSISWFAGALLGVPLAIGFVHLLSVMVIPVDFIVDPTAFIVMLVAILAIATLASFAPTAHAARMRIATMLRYE